MAMVMPVEQYPIRDLVRHSAFVPDLKVLEASPILIAHKRNLLFSSVLVLAMALTGYTPSGMSGVLLEGNIKRPEMLWVIVSCAHVYFLLVYWLSFTRQLRDHLKGSRSFRKFFHYVCRADAMHWAGRKTAKLTPQVIDALWAQMEKGVEADLVNGKEYVCYKLVKELVNEKSLESPGARNVEHKNDLVHVHYTETDEHRRYYNESRNEFIKVTWYEYFEYRLPIFVGIIAALAAVVCGVLARCGVWL